MALPAAGSVPGVEVEDRLLGGIPCRTVSVAEPRASIIHLHGGGFRMGTATAWTNFAGRLAQAVRATVVLVDYRLAPEHPFPAALHDAAAVYDVLHVLPGFEQRPLFLAGDSAGGGLAAATVVAAAMADLPPVDGLLLLSPWLDLGCASGTFGSKAATDFLFSLEAAREAAEQYLQGHPHTDPLASPLRAAVPFPPTLVLASADETLLGDSLDMVRRLAERGIDVSLHVVSGVVHAWPAVRPDSSAAEAALRQIAQFMVERSPAPAEPSRVDPG